ncbi:hypothetical protein EC991_000802 [Linnemannia zychae]|nr:hypothetical protein EC991_000802 [Linnemannia zychae]
MATGYMVLAWWARTSEGSAHTRAYFQQGDRLDTATKSKSGTLSRVELVTRSIVRISTFLISPLPRLCILIGFTAASFLAAIMQWYKIRNAVDCAVLAPEYRRFCVTTKAAVTSTTVAAFVWLLWLGLWFRRSYRFSRAEQKANEEQQQQLQAGGHGEEILIAMPDEVHVTGGKQDVGSAGSKVAGMNQLLYHSQHGIQMDSHMQHLHNNSQATKGKSLQQPQKQMAFTPETAVDEKDSSLGLGIDITNGVNGIGTSGSHSGSNTTNATTFDSMTPIASRFKQHMDVETASIVGKNATTIARDSIFERTKPNPGRLRDHAKIFPIARTSASSLQEATAGNSNRGTPVFYATGSPAQLSTSQSAVRISGSPSLSGANSPTTPLGRAGYMGRETYKAYNNVPRSASMGAIAAFSHMNTIGSSPSAHASPIPNHHFGDGSIVGTPRSLRSHMSMATFPQSSTEAALAEQSMDEQLKAIRRRSFASEVMRSPGGPASLLESAQMNSPCLGTPRSDFGNAVPGSPSSIISRGKGKFRAAFSSPSLNTAIGTARRRSSLGMSSMINSIVNSPVDSDSPSDYSSAESSITPPSANSPARCGSDSDNDGRSSVYSTSQRRQQMTFSAQELLRAEYGDLYPALPGSSELGVNDVENMNLDTESISSSMGRPRSNSVSSAGTSRSSGGCSYSSSNETQGQGQGQARGAKLPGPPPSFMNKVRNGANVYRSHSHKNSPTPARKFGSNGILPNKSNNSLNSSRKFPSHGDLTKYSWDYRREMPID